MLQINKMATLCTLSTSPGTEGFPFAASLPYAVDQQGRAIASTSSLSAHTRHAATNPMHQTDPNKAVWKRACFKKWHRTANTYVHY